MTFRSSGSVRCDACVASCVGKFRDPRSCLRADLKDPVASDARYCRQLRSPSTLYVRPIAQFAFRILGTNSLIEAAVGMNLAGRDIAT
jgi:hypothetical protein